MTDLRRSLLTIRVIPNERVRVDILLSGRVRLRLNDDPAHELQADTLEDLLEEAATLNWLSAATYEQLHWELDMLALHGS